MVALVGDAELDEGNIFEAMLEGWKQGLRNCWWVIDYNRQSLDAVVREGLWERYEALFKAFGWDVVIVKYGALQQAAFKEPGGEALRAWIDSCPNQLYSALVFQGGAAWRKRLMNELGDQGDGLEADREALGRRTRRADGQSRRPRSAVAARGLRHGGQERPADLLHLLHDQGLRPADRRAQGQSRRPDDAGADGPVARRRCTSGPATSGTSSKDCRCRPRSCRHSSTACRSRTKGAAATRRRAIDVPAELAGHDPADDVDAERASARLLNEIGRGDTDFASASSRPRRT